MRVLSGIVCEFERPHCWPLLLLCRLMGRLPIGCIGRLSAWLLAFLLPSIREASLSYPLASNTHSGWVSQRKGLKGLWEEEACSRSCMHGHPTASPLASFASSWAASPSAASCGLFAERPASQLGAGALRTGPGGYAVTLGNRLKNHLKTTGIVYFFTSNSFGKGSKNY
jgi:hypothetical protein